MTTTAMGYRAISPTYQEALANSQRNTDPAVQRGAVERLQFLDGLSDEELANLDVVRSLQSDLQEHRLDQFNERIESFITSGRWREFPWVSGSGNRVQRFSNLRDWMTAPVFEGGLGVAPSDFISMIAGTRGNTVSVVEALWGALDRTEQLEKRHQLLSVVKGGKTQWKGSRQEGRWRELECRLLDEGAMTREEVVQVAAAARTSSTPTPQKMQPALRNGNKGGQQSSLQLYRCAKDAEFAQRFSTTQAKAAEAWAAYTSADNPITLKAAIALAGLKQRNTGVLSLPYAQSDAVLAKRIADHATARGHGDRIAGIAQELLKLANTNITTENTND